MHHHRHFRQLWTPIIFGVFKKGELIMTEQNLDVDLSTEPGPVYASLGPLFDANGNEVTTDTVSTFTYTLSDSTLASVETQDGMGNGTFTLLGLNGTETVNGTGTTAAGSSITGAATITITGASTVGPATSVQVNLSLTPPS